MTGAVVSTTVMVWLAVLLLPQASVAVGVAIQATALYPSLRAFIAVVRRS